MICTLSYVDSIFRSTKRTFSNNFLYFILQRECTYLTTECTATACPSVCRRIAASPHTASSSLSSKRQYSTELPDYQTVDPYILLEDDLKYIFRDIRQVSCLCTLNSNGYEIFIYIQYV